MPAERNFGDETDFGRAREQVRVSPKESSKLSNG